jgi:hypothetical protein
MSRSLMAVASKSTLPTPGAAEAEVEEEDMVEVEEATMEAAVVATAVEEEAMAAEARVVAATVATKAAVAEVTKAVARVATAAEATRVEAARVAMAEEDTRAEEVVATKRLTQHGFQKPRIPRLVFSILPLPIIRCFESHLSLSLCSLFTTSHLAALHPAPPI